MVGKSLSFCEITQFFLIHFAQFDIHLECENFSLTFARLKIFDWEKILNFFHWKRRRLELEITTTTITTELSSAYVYLNLYEAPVENFSVKFLHTQTHTHTVYTRSSVVGWLVCVSCPTCVSVWSFTRVNRVLLIFAYVEAMESVLPCTSFPLGITSQSNVYNVRRVALCVCLCFDCAH